MTGWVIGYIVGAAIVLVVVVLLVAMIVLARRITAKAEAIHAALQVARDGTGGLWDVADTNVTATRIVDAAAVLRAALAQRGVKR